MRHIGQRPVFVGGNSDGDFQMAEWTTACKGPNMAIFVHHTDAEREFAYDRDSLAGALDRGLDEAAERGWDPGRHGKGLEQGLAGITADSAFNL